MMPPRELMSILTAAAVCLPVAGCEESARVLGPDGSGHTAAASIVNSSAAVLPAGLYLSVIAPADFPPGFPPEVIDLLAGEWLLDLSDPRAYVVSLNGVALIEGRSASNPVRFVMRDTGGPLSCHLESQRQASAVYAWSLENDALTLSVIRDHCTERAFILTFKPWQKQ